MIGRFARVITAISARQLGIQQNSNHHINFVRFLSQTSLLSVAKQNQENDDLLFDLGGEAPSPSKPRKSIKRTEAKPSNKAKQTKVINKVEKSTQKVDRKSKTFDELKYFDSELNLTYVKLPHDHTKLPKLMVMLKSRKYRENNELLAIEGRRLTTEAIQAGLKLKYLLFSNVQQLEALKHNLDTAISDKTTIIRVPHNDLTFWSTLTTCPGIIAIFYRPRDMNVIWNNAKRSPLADATNENSDEGEPNLLDTVELDYADQITVVCDQIREPNNVGGILRTCAAIPCSKVILLKGCADAWDIKALRGGCGAQFRIPIIDRISWEQLESHLPAVNDLSVFIADNKTEDPIGEPIENNTDNIPTDTDLDKARKGRIVNAFKPTPYTEIPFNNSKHVVLIIGGETEGVSCHAFDFMKYVSNQQKTQTDSAEVTLGAPKNAVIQIPLGNGVESLNASVATAILLFEIRKQLSGQ